MTTVQIILLCVAAAGTLAVVLLLAVLLRQNAALRRLLWETAERQSRALSDGLQSAREENSRATNEAMRTMTQSLTEAQRHSAQLQSTRLAELNEQLARSNDTLHKTVREQLARLEGRIETFTAQTNKQLEQLRTDNTHQLDAMRQTVDEKLQKTLDERLAQSFAQVSQRLEQVYKGLGEMQNLATGVGDLKKVLSNVKTRGILGEIQLGAILEQILSPEQYAANVRTKPDSTAVVEFAVRLPGDGDGTVWLPIDAKFPGDCYSALVDAYEAGVPEQVAAAGKELEQRLRQFAKDIHDKYIDPPNTTDFAILFLPFEGLYAEVVRRGMIESLSRDFKVNIAGPTTMAALLNSLQMGFRTLAIQKRSGEVWQVLGEVKTEFGTFNDILRKAQDRLRLANDDLDKLIGTRTRAIQRKLRGVEEAVSLAAPEALLLNAAEEDI